jgi:hypothetical protein
VTAPFARGPSTAVAAEALRRPAWAPARLKTGIADPHTVLALGAAAVGIAEWAYRTRGAPYGLDPNPSWLLVQAAAALASLLYAWRAQSRLRLPILLALALAFHVCWLLLHVHLAVPEDGDPPVYRLQGESLLDGDYPRSEYPPGAVLLFAVDVLLSRSDPGLAHAFLMVPFQLVSVWAVWSLRTRYSAWLAAVVALWPLNAYFWEFRFDLVPTALLGVGLLLAYRQRWGWSGLVLGLGAAVKWTPALSFAALAAWCLVGGQRRHTARLTGGFLAGLLLIHAPLLALSPADVWAAYTQQGGRSITGESLWYLPLRLLGIAEPVQEFAAYAVGAPRWADVLATVLQVLIVLGAIAVAAQARQRAVAVAAAAVVPALFLATNRIFSPQFLVLMLVAWAVAVALLARSEREQLVLGLAAMTATLANAFVYPYVLWDRDATWTACSAAFFVTALVIFGWVGARAVRSAHVFSSARPAVLER